MTPERPAPLGEGQEACSCGYLARLQRQAMESDLAAEQTRLRLWNLEAAIRAVLRTGVPVDRVNAAAAWQRIEAALDAAWRTA
jgi:hypothetical protein